MFLQGEAASEITKAPSDNSTNYCSLQNLMDGKYGLSQLPVLPDVSDFHINVISLCFLESFCFFDVGFLLSLIRKRPDQHRWLQTVQQQVDLSWV